MNMPEFAAKHLRPYRIRGDEQIPTLCPVCHGGEHGDKYTFALNLAEGVYTCKRGHCGARGRFEQLAQMLEEHGTAADTSASPPQNRQYRMPDTPLRPVTDEILQYFAARKLSRATLDAFGVAADSYGNIAFPFARNAQRVYDKYRRPRAPQKGEPKEWQFRGAQPILYGIDMCSFSQPQIITEGQLDAMSLYESGARNVVSVPAGSDNLEWIETCWDWLEEFKTIILFGDGDAPGRKMVQTVARRQDEARCLIVGDYPCKPDGSICKDANEILCELGADVLTQTLQAAAPVPLKGVVALSDVVPYDPTSVPRIRTMIPALDEAIGGLAEGGMTVFTGAPGNGKSTLTGLLLLSAIEQGHSVCAYSGELTKERFQEWIHLQAAGSDFIGLKHDPIKNKQVPHLSFAVRERIIDHYRDKFFLFDNLEVFEHNQSESILNVFSTVARRYGCKLFLVDNLMTSLSDSDEETRAQGRFANALKRFANRYRVHVIQVAHPRKTKAGESIKQDDIGGSSATIRLADSAIVVERPNLRIIKNREGGARKLIECCYCPDIRRIYQADKGDLFRFGWNRDGVFPPQPRADSLMEYAVQFAHGEQPF